MTKFTPFSPSASNADVYGPLRSFKKVHGGLIGDPPSAIICELCQRRAAAV